MSDYSGYLNTLWLIANDVEEILKIQERSRVPKTPLLLKTAIICQEPPTTIQSRNDALSAM